MYVLDPMPENQDYARRRFGVSLSLVDGARTRGVTIRIARRASVASLWLGWARLGVCAKRVR